MIAAHHSVPFPTMLIHPMPLRTACPLVALLMGASACSSPAGLGSVPTALIGLCDRALPQGVLEVEVERDGTIREMEVEIPVSDLPTLIREAALAAERGATLTGAERELTANGPAWEVQLLQEGRRVELVLDEKGSILEIERELRRDEAPRSVLNAADRALPGGTFVSVEILHRGRRTEYHVKKERDGARYKVVLSSVGEVLRAVREVPAEIEIPLAD